MLADATTDLIALAEGLLALVLGGVVGVQRMRDGKDAGFRTMMLVTFASFLFVKVSLVAGEASPTGTMVRTDPIRAIQAVATALGFVGAGIVFHDRHANRTRGLTTAAAVLAVSPVGVAVALGHFILAVGATALLVLVLGPATRLERYLAPRRDDAPRTP